MTSERTALPRSTGWKLRHSAWLLAVAFGVGSFSFVGFVYCAIRVKSSTWKRRAIGTTALSVVALILLLVPLGPPSKIGGGFAAVLWLGLIGYGLFVNREYLAWRSTQEPIKPVVPQAVPTPSQQPASPAPRAVVPTMPTAPPEEPSPAPAPDRAPARVVHQSSDEGHPADDSAAASDLTVGSWQEAEALAAWHMQKLGFEDAHMTAAGADGGIDVRASDAVAQVKHYATAIGAPVIQQLRGAAHGHGAALVYALSGYTKSAVEYANDAAVALFTYTVDGVVRPHNHAAQILHDSAGGDAAFDAAEFETQAQFVVVLQQYFDVMNAKYIEVAKQALAAANGDRRARIFQSVETENARVQAILESLHVNGGRLSSDVLIEGSSAIGKAALRLAEDLQRP